MALWTAAALGEPPPRVIVMTDAAHNPWMPRLRAELASSGFEAVVARPDGWPVTSADAQRLSLRAGAVAALAVEGPASEGADVAPSVGIWLFDSPSGRPAFREVIAVHADPADSADIVALHAVETLRAARARIEEPPHRIETPPEPASTPAPAATASPGARDGRFALSLDAGAAWSPGGLGAAAAVGVHFGWRAAPRIWLLADALMTPWPLEVAAAEGKAHVTLAIAGPSLAIEATPPRAALQVRPGFGLWAGLLAMSGDANPPFRSGHAETVSAVAHVDLGIRLALSRRWALTAQGSAGLGAPEVSLQFAGREIATWGRPLVLGSAGVQATLE